ncbi:MAG: cupin domain-containing protein [Alphaproteobacteria bacterium]|nr:cupin domain-containing protein [Alphaproteobacteria bacterium]
MSIFNTEIYYMLPLVVMLSGCSSVGADEELKGVKKVPVIIKSHEMDYAYYPGKVAGAKQVVLSGDPHGGEMFTARAQWPKCYTNPPHWFSYDQTITVISGTLNLGFGDKIDKSKTTVLKAGDVAFIPAYTHEYAWAGDEVVFQLTAMGPRSLVYVNPEEISKTSYSHTCP